MEREKAARGAAFFWFAAVAAALAAFVAWNDPLRHAATRFVPLLLAALVLAACAGYGSLTRVRDPIAATAIGIGAVGLLVFVAGLMHRFSPAFFWGVVVAGLGCGVAGLRGYGVAGSRGRGVAALFTARPRDLATVILVTIVFLITPFVLAPDISTDSLEYHLLIPRLHLQTNGVSSFPLFVESHYPSLGEHLFTLLLGIGDDVAAKGFHFLCAMLVLVVLARRGGWLAAALFFSMPVAALTSGWAWNDMLFTLFVLLSLDALIDEQYVVAGVMFGLASWTKYTFVLAGFGIVAVFLRRFIRPRGIVRFAIPVVAIAAIWMTRNVVDTGNPVYPFLNGVFHAPEWTATAERYFRGTLTRFEIPEWHWWTWLAFPVLLTLKPRVIDVHPGPLPLLLLPLAFIRSERRDVMLLRAYAIGITVGWLIVRTEARSLLSLFAVLAMIYAIAFESLSSAMKRAVSAVIAAGFALNVVILLVTTHVVTDPFRYFLGLESRADYVVRMDEKQSAYRWLDEQPDVRRVLLVGLHDPYYLRKPAVFSSCCDTPVAEAIVRRDGTIDAIAADLKNAGVTHVAFRESGFARNEREHLYDWSPAQRETFRAFLRERCRPVMKSGGVIILRLL